MLTNGGPGDGFISSMMPGKLECKGGSTWMNIYTIATMIGNIDIMFAIVWLSYTALISVTPASVSISLHKILFMW